MPEDIDPLDEVIGENLRLARMKMRMSREELARRVAAITGTAFRQQAVFRIERGLRPLRLSEAVAAAGILGVDLATLTQADTPDRARAENHRKIVAAATLIPTAASGVSAAMDVYRTAVDTVRDAVAAVPESERAATCTPKEWDAINQATNPEVVVAMERAYMALLDASAQVMVAMGVTPEDLMAAKKATGVEFNAPN